MIQPEIVHRYQQYLSDPDKNIKGDCYRTCIAMLIGVHPDTVPHFIQEDPFLRENQDLKWLDDNGFQMERFTIFNPPYKTLSDLVDHLISIKLDMSCMILGRSPRHERMHHGVVYDHTKQIILDPHPSGDGLVYDGEYWGFRFFYPKGELLDSKYYDILNITYP